MDASKTLGICPPLAPLQRIMLGAAVMETRFWGSEKVTRYVGAYD
jgi:hypothetical protein